MSDLIDTTEMYLRTVYELQEENVVPLRARIAQRLGQSGPTVSQTVARMERDGLLTVTADRTIEFTPLGRQRAVRVMRKHRLAECLLADIIGLDWESVHDEACRWEHVISEHAERRLLQVLGHPTQSPFGNPIPGLAELDPQTQAPAPDPVLTLTDAVGQVPAPCFVVAIAERLQEQADLMLQLRRAGIRPGVEVSLAQSQDGSVTITTGHGSVTLPSELTASIAVRT